MNEWHKKYLFMTRLRFFTFNFVLICNLSFSSLPAEKVSFAVDGDSVVLDDDSSVSELDSSMIEEERLAADVRD